MGALVCSVCGGKLIMGANGVATCESCGMEYSQDALKSQLQEIRGTVQIDNSNQIFTWKNLAWNAKRNKDYLKAQEYYTKIISADPSDYETILDEGEAIVCSTDDTGEDKHFSYVSAFDHAMAVIDEYVREDEKKLKKIDLVQSAVVFLGTHDRHTRKSSPSEEYSLDELLNEVQKQREEDEKEEFYERSVNKSILQIMDEYSPLFTENIKKSLEDKADNPTDPESLEYFHKAWGHFLDYWIRAYSVICKEPLYIPPIKAEERQPYLDQFLYALDKISVIDPNYTISEIYYPNPFEVTYDEIADEYKQDSNDNWVTVENPRRKEHEKQVKKYWENRIAEHYLSKHSEERELYESKKKEIFQGKTELAPLISSLQTEISNVQAELKRSVAEEQKKAFAIEDRIKGLQSQADEVTGLFAGRKKKELQVQIDQAQKELSNVQEASSRLIKSLSADADEKIKGLNQQLTEATEKLNALNKEEQDLEADLLSKTEILKRKNFEEDD